MTSEAGATKVDCCVVGAGPGGVVLSLLLARKGVRVLLLEAHEDLDRDFRGDTVHPSTLEMLDGIGLAEGLLAMEHVKGHEFALTTSKERIRIADFRSQNTRFPYIAFLPQARFLDYLVGEARKCPSFEIRMGARAHALVIEDDAVRGVRCKDGSGEFEVAAALTVGADGRGSRICRLAGFEPVKNAPPMDVLWFVLPRRAEEKADEMLGLYVGVGSFCVVFGRPGSWQVGYVILKGNARQLREQGLEKLRQSTAEMVPALADRMGTIQDWSQCHFLNVESSRLERWYRPGLLLIGDAAHVMSPVGGVGINYAIQDAVATANLLGSKLGGGTVAADDLAVVQRRRELPTRFIQGFQATIQKLIVRRALSAEKPFTMPLPARVITSLPLLRNIPGRVVGWGLRPERVED